MPEESTEGTVTVERSTRHGDGAENDVEHLDVELDDQLRAVDAELTAAIRSDQAIITEMSGHLHSAGGKRMRPMLALLCGRFGDGRDPRVVSAAVTCELTHLASLYHDDVMDEAMLRRGVDTANARWTNILAILTGDYLFSQAGFASCQLGPEMAEIHSLTSKRLVSGQIREIIGPLMGQDPMKHYLRVTQDKTGSLISAACRLGALAARAPAAETEVVTRYGEALGMAFQFSDDILDITTDYDESGKQLAQDLRAKVQSLPVLHARASADPADPADEELVSLLDSDLQEDVDGARRAALLLAKHPGMEAARADLAGAVERACAALEPLPDIAARAKLHDLARSMLSRTT